MLLLKITLFSLITWHKRLGFGTSLDFYEKRGTALFSLSSFQTIYRNGLPENVKWLI